MTDERTVVTHTEQTAPGSVAPSAPVYGAPPPGYVAPVATSVAQSEVRRQATGNALAQRLIIFVFGVLQGLLVIRIVLLLLAARERNDLVTLIYSLSEVFVAPFRGILGQDQIAAGQTALDVSAIVALIGWTVIEVIILGLVKVFRRA